MITLYSGTPGSGKSYHAIVTIAKRFVFGGGVIANFPIQIPDNIKPKKEFRFSYWDNSDITPDKLALYGQLYHKEGIEGQTLLVVDEAQVIWNARSFTDKNRMGWVKFFSQHRKLGFDILVIAQNDRMLDKQMRMLIEYEVKHRKINNYGFGGFLFSFFGKFTWFIAIKYWYGGNKLKLNQEMIRYQKKFGRLYDSYKMFEVKSAPALDVELSCIIGDTTVIGGKKVALQSENKKQGKEKMKLFRVKSLGDERSELESVSREIVQGGPAAETRT